MDVVHFINDFRRRVQIVQRAFFVLFGINVNRVNGGPSGCIVDAVAAERQVKFWRVLAIDFELFRRHVDACLDQTAREQNAFGFFVPGTASIEHCLLATLRCVGHADLLKGVQGNTVDLTDIFLRQRLIVTAGHAGSNRPQIFRQRCSTFRMTGSTTARTT